MVENSSDSENILENLNEAKIKETARKHWHFINFYAIIKITIFQ